LTGTAAQTQGYYPWGETRFGSLETEYQFTGQYRLAALGLDYFNARWYDPALSRWTQPDTDVPESQDGRGLDRYAYANNNPLYYTDPSGHIPIPVIIVIAIVALKVIDYGWTAYDAWQSGRVLADPNASQEAKDAAAVSLALTVGFEAAEPDDLLPVSLPLDDLARRGLVTFGKEAGERTFRSYTRRNFRENLRRLTGSSLDDIVGREAHHVLPQQFAPDFAEAGININDPIFGSWVDAMAHRDWSYAYNQRWKAFLMDKHSAEEILDFARKLAEEYGFDVYFSSP